MKRYHYDLHVHEDILAETEPEAQAELRDRWPFEVDRFELADVQDVPAYPGPGLDGDSNGLMR